MDHLTFLSEIIKAIAWPISVIIIVFSLRKPIIKLLPDLKKFKYRDLELEFADKIAELRETAFSEFELETKNEIVTNRIDQLISISPSVAILESWKEVESSLKNLLNAEPPPNASSYQMLKVLRYRGIITNEEYDLLNQLRLLRNKAAHIKEAELDIEDAKDYIIVSLSSIDKIVQRAGRINRNTKEPADAQN